VLAVAVDGGGDRLTGDVGERGVVRALRGITQFTESIGGDLGANIADDGSASLTLADLHGDVVTTIPISAAATTDAAAGIAGWADYDEYGNPADTSPDATTAGRTVTGNTGYGWLGAKQRFTSLETASLTLMGDRLYNRVVGSFTSVDPEAGGNDTDYSYPSDPINSCDLDGHSKYGDFGGSFSAGVAVLTPIRTIRAPSLRGAGIGLGSLAAGAAAGAIARHIHPNSRQYKKRTWGYTIYYRGQDRRKHVWKYGITSRSPANERPRRQLSSCRRMMRSTCTYRVNVEFSTRVHALAWESRMVQSYRQRHGGYCPPGQWRSCR
jgi:hypothetical protein